MKIELSREEASVIVEALSEHRKNIRNGLECAAKAVSTTVPEFEAIVANLKGLDVLKAKVQTVALGENRGQA